MSGKVITKDFDAILEDIKNNRRTNKSISVQSCGSNINLYLLIIKLLNAEKNSAQRRLWI